MTKEIISKQIEQFSTLVNNAVDEGTLVGTSSPPPVAANRLNAFKEMITNFQSLFNAGRIEDCYVQLISISNKCNAVIPPVDFVKGDARAGIAIQVGNLISIIAVEIERDHAYGCLKAQGNII